MSKNNQPLKQPINDDLLRVKILVNYTALCEEFGEEKTLLKFQEFVFFVLMNKDLKNKIPKKK